MDHRYAWRVGTAILTAVVATTLGPPIFRFLNRQAAYSEMSTREGVERRLRDMEDTEPALATIRRSFPRDYAAMVTDVQRSAIAHDHDGIAEALVGRPNAIMARNDKLIAISPLPHLLHVAETERQMFEALSVRRCAAVLRGRPTGDPTPNDLVLTRRWQDARLQAIAAGRDTPSPSPPPDAAAMRDLQLALRGERTSDDAWRVIFTLRSRADTSDAAVCEAQRKMLRAIIAMPPRSAKMLAGQFFG